MSAARLVLASALLLLAVLSGNAERTGTPGLKTRGASRRLRAKSLCSGTATYEITFNFNWTPDTNPNVAFPSFPHFSPVVAASHNKFWTMWASGGFANRGVEDVSETGSFSRIVSEMRSERNVFNFDTGAGSNAKGRVKVQVSVNGETGQTLLSAISMIAPSPDWFVGVSRRNMCRNNSWVSGPITRELRGYNAGTSKDGTGFTDGTSPRVTEKPLKQIKRLPKSFGSFGTMRITMV